MFVRLAASELGKRRLGIPARRLGLGRLALGLLSVTLVSGLYLDNPQGSCRPLLGDEGLE